MIGRRLVSGPRAASAWRRVLGLAGLIVPCLSASPSSPPQFGNAQELLAHYERADYDTVTAALAAVTDFSHLRDEFERVANEWITNAAAAEASRRRLVAATVALEIGKSAVDRDWLAVRPLVEWACALLRDGPPRPAERTWHLASIALASRARDTRLLLGVEGPDLWYRSPNSAHPLPALGNPVAPYGWKNIDHLAHAERRFPDEARFQLARMFALEPALENVPPRDNRWPRVYWRVAVQDEQGRMAIRRYETLLNHLEIGAEARLRTGSLWLRVGEPGRAIQHLSLADSRSREPFIRYLARYFAGEANELLGRPVLAREAYRAALEVVPGAQSGVVRLSVRLFLEGRRIDATELATRSLAMTPRPADPWRLYSYGDFRMWETLIASLRANLR